MPPNSSIVFHMPKIPKLKTIQHISANTISYKRTQMLKLSFTYFYSKTKDKIKPEKNKKTGIQSTQKAQKKKNLLSSS